MPPLALARHVDAIARDARSAFRLMARAPAFTAVALLMIALGTGANAAMFSVIDAVLLRTPFDEPERIAIVRIVSPAGRSSAAVSLDQYRSLVESAPALAAVGALGSGLRPILAGLGEPRRMNVECVTSGVFKVLGTPALIGRTYTADEDRAGGPSVVVLSYSFWQRELGASRDAIGRVLTLNSVPTTVIGVMPRRFLGPLSRNGGDGWLPLGPALGGSSKAGCQARSNVTVFARLGPGATIESATAQATASAGIARLADASGRTGARLALMSIDEQTFSDFRTQLFALLGAVTLVLLIACANVANLQLERVFGRRHEVAVQIALGATRGRITRQILTENVMLYIAGAAAGLAAARWTIHLLVALMPANLPHVDDIQVNGRILAATFAIAALSAIAVGLLPAVQTRTSGVSDQLRTSPRTSTGAASWTRRVLVISQIALSLTLLVGATLMVRTFLTLRPSHPGFNPDDKLTALVRLQGPSSTPLGSTVFFESLLERVRSAPGVQGVTGSTYLPMSGSVSIATANLGSGPLDVFTGSIVPNYFAEMEIPLTRGRSFDARDKAGAPLVAVVNEAMALRLAGDGDALGSELAVRWPDGRTENRQVVGILRNTRSSGSDTRARPELYVPLAQNPSAYLNLIVRTGNASDPRLPAAVRSAVAATDPSQVVDRFAPLEDLLDARVASWRFGAWLLGLFATMALLLAATGLAVSIAWWVAHRTREIGVRMALGAEPRRITGLVLRQGLALGLTGTGLGIVCAYATSQLLESWLYGVSPRDTFTLATSAVGMLLVAALACYIPARRATRIDPLVALRAE